jgi:hypothetical protein
MVGMACRSRTVMLTLRFGDEEGQQRGSPET